MHLCACVSEERSNGEGAGSQALSLMSDSNFWEHQSAYTVTMQLNTVRSNAADIQKHKIIHTTTPTYTRHPADRALCHQAGDVSMHRRISPALPAIRVAFAPGGVPVVNSHVRLLHLHFLHFITPTNKPCQSLLHHTLLALTMLHQQVSKCTGSRAQSESCCRVSSALNLCYLQTASTHLPRHIQHKLTKPRHFF